MARLTGLMAATSRLAAPAGGGGNRTRAEIAEFGELAGDDSASRFQLVERIGHVDAPSLLAYYIRTEYASKKRNLPTCSLSCRAPPYQEQQHFLIEG
jgi:hypothetical protein